MNESRLSQALTAYAVSPTIQSAELIEALETIASQASGIVTSSARSDCMAAVASAALRNYRKAAQEQAKPTDLSAQLRKFATGSFQGAHDQEQLLLDAADEIERSTPARYLDAVQRYEEMAARWLESQRRVRALEAKPTEERELTDAARDVLAERLRQVSVKDWTPEHDDAHPNGEIAAFAAVYAMPPAARDWSASNTGYGDTFGAALCPEDWHPKFGDRRRELIKAGALVLAEIERIDRASLSGATAAQKG